MAGTRDLRFRQSGRGSTIKRASTSTPDQREAAQLVHEHVLEQWRDQVGYAETLLNRRKIHLSLLAALVGLGVYKIAPSRPLLDLVLGSSQSRTGEPGDLLVAFTIFGLLCAGYFLTTDRPTLRPALVRTLDFLVRNARYLFRLARLSQNVDRERLECEAAPPPDATLARGRASNLFMMSGESLEDWFALSPLDVEQERAARIGRAWLSLSAKNDRVGNRLWWGGFLLLLSAISTCFVLVLAEIPK